MGERKYYTVWIGVNPGVYDNWIDCQLQVKNYTGAKYKSFPSREAAEEAFSSDYNAYLNRKSVSNAPSYQRRQHDIPYFDKAITVDASCLGNPGVMEYRGVMAASGKELFRIGPYHDGTNNIGEFLAIVHALALMKKHNHFIPIYTDSVNAMSWVRQKRCKTQLKPTERNGVIFNLIERAELWLRQNQVETPILKWNTEQWGEIPADFGRK